MENPHPLAIYTGSLTSPLSLVSTTAFPDCNRMLKTSLQEDLKKVTDLSEFDAVVLARAHGKAMTKTAKLADWYGSNDLHFNIGVVDGSTGRLLYYCESTATGNYMSAPDSWLSGPVAHQHGIIRWTLLRIRGSSPKVPAFFGRVATRGLQ